MMRFCRQCGVIFQASAKHAKKCDRCVELNIYRGRLKSIKDKNKKRKWKKLLQKADS